MNFEFFSVSGLSFDFLALNITGFLCYTIFNIGLFWIPEIQAEYFARHPRGVIPVEANDVFFAIHAVCLTLVQITQCFIYPVQFPTDLMKNPKKILVDDKLCWRTRNFLMTFDIRLWFFADVSNCNRLCSQTASASSSWQSSALAQFGWPPSSCSFFRRRMSSSGWITCISSLTSNWELLWSSTFHRWAWSFYRLFDWALVRSIDSLFDWISDWLIVCFNSRWFYNLFGSFYRHGWIIDGEAQWAGASGMFCWISREAHSRWHNCS